MAYKFINRETEIESGSESSSGPYYFFSSIINKPILFILILFFSITTVYSQANNDDANEFRLAQSFEQSGRLEKAEEIYRDLLQRNGSFYQYFESLNKVLVNQKKYSESIDLIQNRIKQTPQDINLYGLLGSTYYMMDQLNNAYASWERGIATNPQSTVVYRLMANYAIENRAFDKAIDILQRGKKLSEDPLIFSLDLANIYSINMRFAEAAKEYCLMLESKPNELGVAKSRITSYLSRPGSAEATLATVKKFAAEKPLPQILDLLTFVCTSTGNYNEGLNSAIEYEHKTNSNGNFLFTFAQQAYRGKEFSAASKAYDYVINNFPNSTLVPIAKIGYAATLEADTDEKYKNEVDSWKPYYKPAVIHKEEYLKIIAAYKKLADEYPDNAIYPQAIFNIANIYKDHLLQYQKADSLFAIINDNQQMSGYSVEAFLSRGKIAVIQNRLNDAREFFLRSISTGRTDPNQYSEANYYLAKIQFWNGKFSEALDLFKNVTKNMSADFANDAIEISSLISAVKKDSLNLSKYAKADLYSFQNKFKEAANEFKTLAENPNLFILNEFANFKFSEMLIADDDLPTAIKTLEVLIENSKTAIFSDKSTFLVAEVYRYGIRYTQKAIQFYEKLLEKFPNSLYFDRARDAINLLKTNNG